MDGMESAEKPESIPEEEGINLKEQPDEPQTDDAETDDDDESVGIAADDDDDEMPLLYYTRLPRSSENTATAICTCSSLGKLLLTAETTAVDAGDSIHVWQSAPLFLTALGFDNGCVQVVDSRGNIIIPPQALQIREAPSSIPVVDVVWDSSGTVLAAIDSQGACAVWEIRYQIEMRQRTQLATPANPANSNSSNNSTNNNNANPNAFRNFMSALTGTTMTMSASDGMNSRNSSTHGLSANSRHGTSTITRDFLPVLTTNTLQVHRSSYPKTFGAPTCAVIDPAYRQRREKCILVGFAGGHLVLTKRGTILFQRRNDTILYQSDSTDKSFRGIEALTWRDSLVAWADASGVKIMDTEAWTRLASIDRPAGARPTLYPSLTGMRPHLVFETSERLLVAWGDCLLALIVRERRVPAGSEASSAGAENGGSSPTNAPIVVRKTVELCMAWELDCVACGVAPVDDEHIAILGFVVPPESELQNNKKKAPPSNSVEVHVLCRTDGQVLYSDLLPIERLPVKTGFRGVKHAESIDHVTLLSTFSVARMDDKSELQVEQNNINHNGGNNRTNGGQRFRDEHLRWNLGSVSFDRALFYPPSNDTEEEDEATDDSSVDSENYEQIFKVIHADQQKVPKFVGAPAMVMSTGVDLVGVRVRGLDDAVHDALEARKPCLALCRALADPRQLRRYTLPVLVDEYLKAILRLPRTTARDDDQEHLDKPLSIRRMQLASAAMPVLLGGNSEHWTKWLTKLEGIPGALFAARGYIPVRDPKLLENVYTKVLIRMYTDAVTLLGSSSSMSQIMEDSLSQFMGSLLAWGTTSVLRNHIEYYRYQAGVDGRYHHLLQATETSLRRREQQSASGYLKFTSTSRTTGTEAKNESGIVDSAGDKFDALYSCDELMMVFCQTDRLVNKPGEDGGDALYREVELCSLDAQARLCLMQGRLDEALKLFLTIGATLTSRTLEEIEKSAVNQVSGQHRPEEVADVFVFVLAMIETHHLHQFLLDENFLATEDSSEETISPLFALVKLVGLELFGNFLLKHCTAPAEQELETRNQRSVLRGVPSDKTSGERRGTLPLDCVAAQLGLYPGLLHWYLDMVLLYKPEIYVKFPNTAHPPSIIVDLHRKSLLLHILYAGINRDSSLVLQRVETYKAGEAVTPLLRFIKNVVHIGGIGATEVAKLLEKERKGGSSSSGTFALELAYILENFGQESEAEARLVMDLYLRGAQSLMLAVLCAQRIRDYSDALWAILIDHCLAKTEQKDAREGTLFGSLLEAAALSGADLALLVTQIPTGMSVEGLRPRLVAAVGDYRMKLLLHQASSEVASTEFVTLLRESAQRSRRGARCELKLPHESITESKKEGKARTNKRRPIKTRRSVTRQRSRAILIR